MTTTHDWRETVTGETITDEQIEQLRAEAIRAGDFALVRICDLAREPPIAHIAPGLAKLGVREIAGRASSRAECARIINETVRAAKQ
jgi:hypothetical protein